MENKEKELLKDVSSLYCSEEEAEKHYKEYLEALKTRKEQYLEDLKKVYYNLKQGNKVINVFEAIKNAGLNEKQQPRLAISRAGFKEVIFIKQNSGSGSYGNELDSWKDLKDKACEQVNLPSQTFENWETQLNERKTWREIVNPRIKTTVPLVPADLLPKGNLQNYYILWEVKDWQELPPTKDPFLLKRISSNLFVVLAEWDLTAIEQAVIAGLK